MEIYMNESTMRKEVLEELAKKSWIASCKMPIYSCQMFQDLRVSNGQKKLTISKDVFLKIYSSSIEMQMDAKLMRKLVRGYKEDAGTEIKLFNNFEI